jgi:hypothetical protein
VNTAGRKLRKTRLFLSHPFYASKSNDITKEAPERYGDFKVGGQVINILKYANHLVLLAKEETALQGMTDRLLRRCYGIEVNVGKTRAMSISKATILNAG